MIVKVIERIECAGCTAVLAGPDFLGLAKRRRWDWIDRLNPTAECPCGRGKIEACPCRHEDQYFGRCARCRRRDREQFGEVAG